jgi:hypothetical protein
MRTDDLIHLLVADQRAPSISVERGLAIAVTIGLAVAAALFWISLGPRDDIVAAATTPRFVFKVVESLLLAGAAALLVVRLSRPGADMRAATVAVFAAPALLAITLVAELVLVSPTQWQTKLVGSNSVACITAIPLMSLPLLVCALYALRQGAPTRPGLAGGVAGMLAGGLAAALYAMKCTDDSPLFVAVWYSLAISAVSLVGAIAGQRVLRW